MNKCFRFVPLIVYLVSLILAFAFRDQEMDSARNERPSGSTVAASTSSPPANEIP